MKRTVALLFFAVSILSFSAAVTAEETMDIKEAFKKGLISITVTGRAKGELAELFIKKKSDISLIITIKKGKTDLGEELSIKPDRDIEINLTKKDEAVIVLPQTGANRISSGPVELENK